MNDAALQEIEAACWRELAAAVVDRAHPWRTPVLATRDGEGADARTVVLREVEAATRRLRFFTDARSPKLRQLQAHPHGTVVAWSPALGWQLRLQVHLQPLDEAATVQARWQRIARSRSAGDYLAPRPPGAPLHGSVDGSLGAATAHHFAIVDATVTRLDWLELRADGAHRRALFGDGPARWVQA